MRPDRRPAPLLVLLAALVLGAGLLVMFWPVLTNPIVADDRYWYPDAAGLTDGSYVGVVTYHLADLDRTATNFGRITVLAFIARSLTMLLVMDLAVWSGTPLVVGQALLKIVLLALIVATVVGFLRVLRHRGPDGSLLRLSWRTVATVALLATVLTGAGAQAHGQFRNGWTSYAVLTWGAVLVMIGTVGLMLWLTRLVARRGNTAKVLAVTTAVLVGLFLNVSYELYYVAVPLVLVALLQQPVLGTDVDPRGRQSREAKLWVGGAFLASFTVVFLGIRALIASLCADRSCYEGSQLDLGPRTLVTATRNLLTAVPGGARTEVRADLQEQGLADQFPGWVTPGSVLLAVLIAVALVVLVRVTGSWDDEPQQRRAEARLLLLAAVLPGAAAVGTALTMGLSSLSHEIVVSVGSPYRSTMVTWTMIALTLAMVATALQTARPRRPAPMLVAAALVVVLCSHTLALNYPALRASHVDPDNQVVAAVHREIVLGDPSQQADERRCRTVQELRSTIVSQFSRDRILAAAESAFRHYHGGPYCSETPP